MDSHDNIEKLMKKLSPEFAELNQDIIEIAKLSKDPVFLGMLVFKLAQEREKTNKLLEEINKKLEVTQSAKKLPYEAERIEVLSEIDQMIIKRIEELGQVDAADIKNFFGYKRLNAASQRLNRLYKEGYLKKIRSGKKVFFALR